MKEAIYTIPVNEAFDKDSECPFCNLHHSLEEESIEYMLGASYMEDDIRAETDKSGFCKRHYEMMYKNGNRLGLALMVQTHLQKVVKDMESLSATLKSEKKGIFSKSKAEDKLTPHLKSVTESCYVCNRINSNFNRYIDTFFYMWKKDSEMKNKVKNSKGFCIEHLSMLLEAARKKLSDREFNEFVEIVMPVELENMKRLLGEIDHFINKFDHNYSDAPWGTAKDSLVRGILKASGIEVKE